MLRPTRLEQARPRQPADLLAGRWQANIHTAANPGGELRG
ncbi:MULTISPECIES: CHRD domain-containing protein [unclassified Bradyrhizobium]|nr:CHRD domain-containing protein [Bradyrhizobium sp. WSM1253]